MVVSRLQCSLYVRPVIYGCPGTRDDDATAHVATRAVSHLSTRIAAIDNISIRQCLAVMNLTVNSTHG